MQEGGKPKLFITLLRELLGLTKWNMPFFGGISQCFKWNSVRRGAFKYLPTMTKSEKFFILGKSNSKSAQLLTVHFKIRWKNVKTCRFGSAKWFWPRIKNSLLRLVKGKAKPNTCNRRVSLGLLWALWERLWSNQANLQTCLSHLIMDVQVPNELLSFFFII
jgi:hypothetical protein